LLCKPLPSLAKRNIGEDLARIALIAPAFSHRKSMARQFTAPISSMTARSILCPHVLRGFDRNVLATLGYTKGAAWP
jgi:hypothetical protein